MSQQRQCVQGVFADMNDPHSAPLAYGVMNLARALTTASENRET